MNRKLIAFKLSFLKNIGDISEKRIEIINKEFSGEFPIKNNIPTGLLLAKNIDSVTVKSLFVLPTQVTYSIEGENTQKSFYEAKSFAKRVFDKLFFDYKCNLVCNYTCLVEAEGISELLKNKMDIRLKNEKEIQGIGIKIFLNNDDYTGNFIFEPYVRDLKYMYCNLELQILNISGVSETVKEAEKIFDDVFDDLVVQSYHKIKKLGE